MSITWMTSFLGLPASSACASMLALVTQLCSRLGLPVAPEKTVGPSTVITFLGIEIDSIAQQLRLPNDKLSRLQQALSHWERKRNASKQELETVIGCLSHVAVVVCAGRVFIHHLIDTSKIPRRPHHRVQLNADCRADLAWWSTYVVEWNGIALFPSLPSGPTLVSDASGRLGCGSFSQADHAWFQLEWPPSWVTVNIAIKELIPIVISSAIWGSRWQGTSVTFLSDNQAVVTFLTKRSAWDLQLTHLIRCLFFFQAHFRFEYNVQHVAGKMNAAADALSRNMLDIFHSLYPHASHSSTPVPSSHMDLLTDRTMNWTLAHWKVLFSRFLHVGLPRTL